MKNSPILIIGKNGKTGARVNQRLQALGYATRAVSRSTTPSFDWEDRSTWRNAIAGARAAYVTYQPDLAVPNAEADMKAFMQFAAEAELGHVVLLSGRGEEGAERAEEILKDGGISWNIVRASWFAQNFSESFMLEGILAGELVLPAADTVEPFIDVDDIADVAVAAITHPGLRNKLFEVHLTTVGDRRRKLARTDAKRTRILQQLRFMLGCVGKRNRLRANQQAN